MKTEQQETGGKTTLTMPSTSGYQMGEWVEVSMGHRPWWKRLWHWITRHNPNCAMVVTELTPTSMTVAAAPTPRRPSFFRLTVNFASLEKIAQSMWLLNAPLLLVAAFCEFTSLSDIPLRVFFVWLAVSGVLLVICVLHLIWSRRP